MLNLIARLSLLSLAALMATVLMQAGLGSGGVLDEPALSAQATSEQQKRKEAREKKKRAPAEKPAAKPRETQEPSPPAGPAAQPAEPPPPAGTPPRERVEADVSTRSIAVTSGYTGSEIVVFGSVDNSRQPSAEAGYYDVVVIVEGKPAPLVARRKSNVAGLWINTDSSSFEAVPSYYAVASTRPIEEIADESLLAEQGIGLDNVTMKPSRNALRSTIASELRDYKSSVIRLKEHEGLYLREDYGVAFIGRSLFRSSVELPANVPVGPLSARVYLFREGALLSRFATRVTLERKGVELVLYDFAHDYPLLYGSFAVLAAIGCGLAASALFGRATH